ncbi:CFEM domain-containing protein [Sarocladium implicatum]|nr:CFEM domain-containing protein [Sarocladium implicatum]
MYRPFHLAALLLAMLAMVISVSAAQDQSPLSQYPDCAARCIGGALMQGLCAPDNSTCICKDEVFQGTVTLCVSQNCTIPDAMTTKNISLTTCGAEVRDRSAHYAAVSNSLVVITGLFVITRFVYKMLFAQLSLGKDDYLVLAAMVAACPSAIITVNGMTANGLGRDIWTLTGKQVTVVLRYFYIMAWLYFTQVTLVKLSIIAFYMRIFPAKGVQRLLWGTFIFTCLWGLAFVLTAIFQCKPIHYFWTKWDGLHEGTCLSTNVISWSNAAINIALDLWILAVPLWQLRKLHLHWKKKIGVVFMFCIGTFVTVVSILRLQSLVHLAKANNPTWDFYDVSIWSTVEICVGIMCACLPTIRLALVRLFPILGGSSHRSRGNQYYEYGTGPGGTHPGRAGGPASARGTVGVVTVDRRGSDPESAASGIVFEKTYDVQFSDDEAKLVQMSTLDAKGRAMNGFGN